MSYLLQHACLSFLSLISAAGVANLIKDACTYLYALIASVGPDKGQQKLQHVGILVSQIELSRVIKALLTERLESPLLFCPTQPHAGGSRTLPLNKTQHH